MDHCALVKCNKRNAERFQTLEEITSLLVIVYMVIAKKESARKPEIQWLQFSDASRFTDWPLQ